MRRLRRALIGALLAAATVAPALAAPPGMAPMPQMGPRGLQPMAPLEPPGLGFPGNREEQRSPHPELRQAPRLTPGEAARRAQAINGGGRVLAVVPTAGGYRVKLIKRGEVRVVFVPGE